jgi:hypothetical protein
VSIRVRAEADPELEAALVELLPREPELSYANFAPIAKRAGAAAELHAARWRVGAGRLFVLVARDPDGAPLGALRVERRPFESAHFGIPMARIEAPAAVASPTRRAEAVAALLGEAVSWLRARGFAHVALRASAQDRATLFAARAQGAFSVGTQVSWMCALTGTQHEEPLPPGFQLETRSREALRESDPATWKQIVEWGARGFDKGPFLFDPTLPEALSRGVYQVWSEKVMRGEWADAVVCVQHAGEVVAFISLQVLADVSQAAGSTVLGRCLAATLPRYRGLATAIVREIVATRPLGGSWLEGETPVTTLGTINLFAKTGFRYLRATALFHLRLDDGRDG